MTRGVQWWEPGTPLYCKMVNTDRAAVVVRSGHPIAKVIALNVRDDDRFRALFVHPTPSDPTAKSPVETRLSTVPTPNMRHHPGST